MKFPSLVSFSTLCAFRVRSYWHRICAAPAS